MIKTNEEPPFIPLGHLRFVLLISSPGKGDNSLLSSAFMDVPVDEYKQLVETQVEPIRAAFREQREKVRTATKAEGCLCTLDPQKYGHSTGCPYHEKELKEKELKLQEAETNAWDYASRAALLHCLSKIVGPALKESREKGAEV